MDVQRARHIYIYISNGVSHRLNHEHPYARERLGRSENALLLIILGPGPEEDEESVAEENISHFLPLNPGEARLSKDAGGRQILSRPA